MSAMTRCSNMIVIIVVLATLVTLVRGYPAYTRRYPNGFVVPLLNGAYCKATGHPKCAPYQDDDANVFGVDFQVLGKWTWSKEFCMYDSDRDGQTNGDELGDPCCTWRPNGDNLYPLEQPRRVNPNLSDPDDITFLTTYKSCALDGAPATPQSVTATVNTAGTAIQVEFTQKDETESCTCGVYVHVHGLTPGATDQTFGPYAFDVTSVSVSGITPDANGVMVSVSNYNLSPGNGSSANNPWIKPQTGTVDGTATAVDTPRPFPTPVAGQRRSSSRVPKGTRRDGDLEGDGESEGEAAPGIDTLIAWVVVIFTAVFGLILRIPNVRAFSLSRFLLFTNLLPITPPKSKLAGSICEWLLIDTLSEVSVGELIVWGVYAAINVIPFFTYQTYYRGDIGHTVRSLGHLLNLNLALVLLPITRSSVWAILTGMPFERTIRLHRAIGRVLWWLAMVHGFGMWYAFDNFRGAGDRTGNTGAEIVLSVGPGTKGSPIINNLAGFIALMGFSVLTLTSLAWFRRKFFEFFYYSHVLVWPVTIAFSMLHFPGNSTSTPIVGIVLYALDCVLRLWKAFISGKFAIVRAEKLGDNVVSMDVVFTPRVKGLPGILSLSGAEAGQWVQFALPKYSVLQWHPFSVCSVRHNDDGTTIANFCIKTMGPGSYSQRMVDEADKLVGSTIWVDGAYGEVGVHMANYGTITLVAGGVGITPMVAIFSELADKVKAGGKAPRSVKLVWSVREVDLIKSVQAQIQAAIAVNPIVFSADIHHSTGGKKPTQTPVVSSDNGDSAGSVEMVVPSSTAVAAPDAELGLVLPTKSGRPQVRELIANSVVEAVAASESSVAVLACGPQVMVNDCKAAARSAWPRCDIHTETFEF